MLLGLPVQQVAKMKRAPTQPMGGSWCMCLSLQVARTSMIEPYRTVPWHRASCCSVAGRWALEWYIHFSNVSCAKNLGPLNGASMAAETWGKLCSVI
jgi:hypothetical protein